MPSLFETRTVNVNARCGFPSWAHDEIAWRDQDRDWQLLVLAVKGDRARMGTRSAKLPLGKNGGIIKFDSGAIGEAGAWFGRWVARKTKELGVVDPVFVAIPNRRALLDTADFRTATLAKSAATAFGAGGTAYTGLRFDQFVSKEMKKRQGVGELVANMRLISEPPDGTLVLVDDVYTQGFHLEAACALLPEGRCPTTCFVAGRTVQEPQADMGAEISVEREFFPRGR